MTFKQAIEIASKVGIELEEQLYDATVLVLKDGTELYFISEYEGDLSEDTPGNGIQPPIVYHKPAGSRLRYNHNWASIPEVVYETTT